MHVHFRPAVVALLGPLLLTAPGPARTSDAACTPQTCPGLTSFESVDALLDDLSAQRNSARLAYELGLSLVRQGCCFAEAVAYLRYALNTRSDLRRDFYDDMNQWSANIAGGLSTRIILAVSHQLEQ